MPITSILILVGIVAAFAVFGLALAWGEYQTRHLVRGDESEVTGTQERQRFKKAA